MMTVNARSTAGPGAPFEATTVSRRDLGGHDVLIDVAYSGICHSDIHTARAEWDGTAFPLVPGHEIAGTVSAVGGQVSRFGIGDRVGVGCYVDSCRTCPQCRAGEQQHCAGIVWTYNGTGRDGRSTEGGYSEKIVVDEHYTVRIPDALALDGAAPLLCAGITLYAPLRRWGAGPGMNVAVVGLGGLGHVGVKLAHAMGADVSVLSQSLKKQEDGLRLGAGHYYATSDPATFTELAGTFDVILSTLSANMDASAYLNLLKVGGTLVNVGMPDKPLSVPAGLLNGARRVLAGSMIGGIAQTQEMLDFCAAHDIGAEIEVITADQIDEAYDRVVASDVRYRFVIDAATFASP
jgi:alcohol dehydrogenase (NADP+)